MRTISKAFCISERHKLLEMKSEYRSHRNCKFCTVLECVNEACLEGENFK